MDKPREIDAKVGRIRPASRETYDARTLTALPSATGGRPSAANPLAAATGTEITAAVEQATPGVQAFGNINDLIPNGNLRYAQKNASFLPSVSQPNRTIEEYTINNQDMVNITASYLERLSQSDPSVLTGFDSAYEAAQWAVSMIQRSFEPGNAPRMVDMIHQTRSGRQVYQYLRQIEEALNAES